MAASNSYASVPPRSTRADGTAWFTAAIVALGVATIVTLDRIGAPEGLVRALGPLLALASTAIVGIASRNADLGSYFAARRSVAPRFGGLALAAIAAGAALALSGGAPASGTAIAGVAVGGAIGAWVVGPMLRRFGASWPSDLIATRFPSWLIRLPSGLAIFAAGALTTLAGLSTATTIVAPLVGSNPFSAAALVGAVAAVSVAPGGLAGLLWTACAAGGVMLAMTGAAAALGAPVGFGADDAAGSGGFAGLVAAAAGAAFFAFEPQAFASASAARAVKAGLIGLILSAGLAMLAVGGLSSPPRLANLGLDRAAVSLAEGARLAAALALASVGAHGGARAFGIPLAAPPRPFPPLASVRLARMRAAQLLVIALAVLVQAKAPVAPQTALSAAMALSLALTAPLLALAALRRAGTLSAGAALAVAAAILAWRFATTPLPSQPPEFFLPALAAALAGFVAGAAVSLAAPRREAEPRPGRFDPFAGPR